MNILHGQPNLLVGSFLSIHIAGLVPVGSAALLTAAAVALTLILLPGLSALPALILLPRLSALPALVLLAGTFLAALVLLSSALALTLVILMGRHVNTPPVIDVAVARYGQTLNCRCRQSSAAAKVGRFCPCRTAPTASK
ncbi:MAG TPA: hypothetical protein VK793_07605 [Steroidobacteraceae bacterium]|nr:hypothetical protein [Steroidobacteraceae bacterium]